MTKPTEQAKKHALTPEMEERKWKPGQSGNPNGRKPGKPCISIALAEILEATDISVQWTVNGKTRNLHVQSDKDMAYGIAAALVMEALKGNVRAVSEIADRVQGRAPLMVELAGADGGPIQITPAHLQSAKDKLDALMLAQAGTNGNGNGHGKNGNGSNGSGRKQKRVKEEDAE